MGKLVAFIIGFFIVLITLASIIVPFSEKVAKDDWENFSNLKLKANIERALESLDMSPSRIKGVVEVVPGFNKGKAYAMDYDNEKKNEIEKYYIYVYENDEIARIVSEDRKNIYHIAMKNEDSSRILLQDGVLGEYGKNVKFDGKKYIKYFVPAGTYEAEAIVKDSMFYIESTKIYKNSFGHDESKTLSTIKLENAGDTKKITIKKNTCISLVLDTVISLRKVK